MADRKRVLNDVGYDIADAYRAGLLTHLIGDRWKDTWEALIEVFKDRCPGFSDTEYGEALNRGFKDSR